MTDFAGDPYFKKFIDRPVSNSTKERTIAAMKTYLEFLSVEIGYDVMPENLLNRIVEDRKKPILESGEIEREWIKYADWLKTSYHKKNSQGKVTSGKVGYGTIKSYCSSIKSFYSYFGYPLGSIARLPNVISANKGKMENEKFRFRPTSIKKMLAVLESNKDKAMLLTMFQSGMDISTTQTLTYGHVKKGLENGEIPLMLTVDRPKGGVRCRTFIGKDSIDAIRI